MRFTLLLLFFTGFFSSSAIAQRTPKTPVLVKEHVFQELNAEKAQTLIYNTSDLVVLDVRTSEEFATGHIKNAVNVVYEPEYFAERLDALDKSKTYLVYCRSGVRSAKAMELMKSSGFHFLYHLEGGVLAWPADKLQE